MRGSVIKREKPILASFFITMANPVKIIKKALGKFFLRLQALHNGKVSEKVMNGF